MPTKKKPKTYAVERLLAMRDTAYGREYLVKWEGYNSAHDSWEPKKNINEQLIDDFHGVSEPAVVLEGERVEVELMCEELMCEYEEVEGVEGVDYIWVAGEAAEEAQLTAEAKAAEEARLIAEAEAKATEEARLAAEAEERAVVEQARAALEVAEEEGAPCKRPRGRAPKGKMWDTENGEWKDEKDEKEKANRCRTPGCHERHGHLGLCTKEDLVVQIQLKAEKQNAHATWLQSVAFSPDGKTIVSGSWDNTLKVWDAGASAL